MCQLGLFSPVSLAINSNKNPDIKFSYIYSSMKTLSENPLKHFPFSFHLAGATDQAIIYPAKMSRKVIQVGEVPLDSFCPIVVFSFWLCPVEGISFSTDQIKVMGQLLRITWRVLRLAAVS